MRRTSFLLLLALGACASGGGEPPTSPHGMISGGQARPWGGSNGSGLVRWPPSSAQGMPENTNSLPTGATRAY